MFWHVWVEFSSSQTFPLKSWIAPAAYGKNIIYWIKHHWWETNLNFLLAETDDLESTQTLLAQYLCEDVPPQWYKNYLELENNLKEKRIFLDQNTQADNEGWISGWVKISMQQLSKEKCWLRRNASSMLLGTNPHYWSSWFLQIFLASFFIVCFWFLFLNCSKQVYIL